MMIDTPIIVDNHGDLDIFDTIDAAQRYLEAIDVRNGEYQAFDAKGYKLKLSVDKRNQVAIARPETPENASEELRNLLIAFFKRCKLSAIALEQLSLETLIKMALVYKTR